MTPSGPKIGPSGGGLVDNLHHLSLGGQVQKPARFGHIRTGQLLGAQVGNRLPAVLDDIGTYDGLKLPEIPEGDIGQSFEAVEDTSAISPPR